MNLIHGMYTMKVIASCGTFAMQATLTLRSRSFVAVLRLKMSTRSRSRLSMYSLLRQRLLIYMYRSCSGCVVWAHSTAPYLLTDGQHELKASVKC